MLLLSNLYFKFTCTVFCLWFFCPSSIDSAVLRKKLLESCAEVPPDELEHVLGSAYNSRYMSIKEPTSDKEQEPKWGPTWAKTNFKRAPNRPNFFEDFRVDGGYARELQTDGKPAWEIENHTCLMTNNCNARYRRDTGNISESEVDIMRETKFKDAENDNTDSRTQSQSGRSKRHNSKALSNGEGYQAEWKCKSEIYWDDLGPDYFPRFVRQARCINTDCWYGSFQCKPKAFTVKLLRRKQGKCAKSEKKLKVGTEGLPVELRELWVWEEHAVSFCCECSGPDDSESSSES